MTDAQEKMQYKIHRAVQWELAKGHMRAALATFVSNTEHATFDEAKRGHQRYLNAKSNVEAFIKLIEDNGTLE